MIKMIFNCKKQDNWKLSKHRVYLVFSLKQSRMFIWI